MRAGDEVAGVTVERVGDVRDGVTRVFGVDPALGEVELLVVTVPDPAARARFAERQRALPEVPGVARAARVVEGEVTAAVRPRLLEATLERLAPPLDPAVAAGIGAAVLPGLLASATVARTVVAADLGVTLDGAPVLAPRLGRDDRVTTAAADLGALLRRWVTEPEPTLDEAIALLVGPEPAAALPLLRQVGGLVDLRPLVSAGPAALAIRTTRAGGDLDVPPTSALAVRVAGWGAAVLVWAVSAGLAVTVVLLPLAIVGAVAGLVVGLGGEVVARRARVSLGDRTVGGRLADAWAAVDHVASLLASAQLAEVTAADVRTIAAELRRELEAAAQDGAGVEREAELAALQARVVRDARRLAALVGRLATDDEAAGAELARWVRGAP